MSDSPPLPPKSRPPFWQSLGGALAEPAVVSRPDSQVAAARERQLVLSRPTPTAPAFAWAFALSLVGGVSLAIGGPAGVGGLSIIGILALIAAGVFWCVCLYRLFRALDVIALHHWDQTRG